MTWCNLKTNCRYSFWRKPFGMIRTFVTDVVTTRIYYHHEFLIRSKTKGGRWV